MEETLNNSSPVETEQSPVDSNVSPAVAGSTQLGNETDGVVKNEVETPEQKSEETFFDPKGLSPELQQAYKQMQADYTRKTQEIADVRKKGETLDQLSKYQPFVDWYNKHRAGLDKEPEQTPAAKKEEPLAQALEELSPEKYAELFNNPKAFREYVQSVALNASAPYIQEAQQKAEFVMNLNKVESFAKEHPDFWELDKHGLIEPLITKYPGMELEDVYRLAKFPFVEDEAVRKAHNIVQDKRVAVTEKPGQVMPGSSRVKVKSREEAMSLAWDYAQKGQEIPDFDFSK